MKPLSPLVIMMALLVVSTANAKEHKQKTSNSISCTEFNDQTDDGSTLNVAKIDIKLGEDDQVSEIKVKRNKTDTQEAFDLTFNSKNSKIKHDTIPGKIIDTDEETHKPIYDWNIEKIEMVEAESAGGAKVRLHINDHTYSGNPGSTVFYTVKGKSFSSYDESNQTVCAGQLRFRMWRQ